MGNLTPFEERTLRSVCYDGHVVETYYVGGEGFTSREQWAQAERHRNRVIVHLRRNHLARLVPELRLGVGS